MKKLFVSSLFRSGSTYLSKVINSLPETHFASDPFFPVFAEIQRQATAELNVERNCISDYYFCEGVDEYFKILQEMAFLERKNSNSPELSSNLEMHQRKFHPNLIPFSHKINLRDRSNLETLQTLFDLLKLEKQGFEIRLHGFKEVWLSEFTWSILNAFSDAFVVFLIRDPRMILKSNMWTNSTYPAMFIAKQWRKHVEIAHAVKSRFPERTWIIRYEDLVIENQRVDFVKFLSQLTVNSIEEVEKAFKFPLTESGEMWKVNSNKPTKKIELQHFHHKSRLIEFICKYELAMMDYGLLEPNCSYEEFKELVRIDKSSYSSEWFREFSDVFFMDNRIEPEFNRNSEKVALLNLPKGSFLTTEYETEVISRVIKG